MIWDFFVEKFKAHNSDEVVVNEGSIILRQLF